MPYLVDGHNLIPKLPGLTLEEIDDEVHLIELLQTYARRSRKALEVYFDNAPPGQPRLRSYGSVTAHFVRQGQTADQAIGARLKRLGSAARNWTVVSSDGQVQAAARAARARVLSSEAFAHQMLSSEDRGEEPPPTERDLSESEIKDWMKLFGLDEDKS
jgi:predicted RNA-binding protein with PIN domain